MATDKSYKKNKVHGCALWIFHDHAGFPKGNYIQLVFTQVSPETHRRGADFAGVGDSMR